MFAQALFHEPTNFQPTTYFLIESSIKSLIFPHFSNFHYESILLSLNLRFSSTKTAQTKTLIASQNLKDSPFQIGGVFVRCKYCNRKLRLAESIARGYGEVCAKKFKYMAVLPWLSQGDGTLTIKKEVVH